MFKLSITLEDLDASLDRAGAVQSRVVEFCGTYEEAYLVLDKALHLHGIDLREPE